MHYLFATGSRISSKCVDIRPDVNYHHVGRETICSGHDSNGASPGRRAKWAHRVSGMFGNDECDVVLTKWIWK